MTHPSHPVTEGSMVAGVTEASVEVTEVTEPGMARRRLEMMTDN